MVYETENILKIIKKLSSFNKKIIGVTKNILKIKKINKVENKSLRFNISRKYYSKGVLNLGDILHEVHPLAGQGLNMTIRDIQGSYATNRKKS